MSDRWLERSPQPLSRYLILVASATYAVNPLGAEALLRLMQAEFALDVGAGLDFVLTQLETLQCQRIKTRKKSQVYLIFKDAAQHCWVLADERSLETLAEAKLKAQGITDNLTEVMADQGLGRILSDKHQQITLFSVSSVVFGYFRLD